MTDHTELYLALLAVAIVLYCAWNARYWAKRYSHRARRPALPTAPPVAWNSETPMKAVCSWCGETMREGRDPVTHGICPVCAEANFALEEAPIEQHPEYAALKGTPAMSGVKTFLRARTHHRN